MALRSPNIRVPDQSYDPRVTDLSQPLIPPGRDPNSGASLDNFRNRNIRNTSAIQLQTGIALRVLGANLRRTGLIVQNKDAAANAFIAYGNAANGTSFQLAPGGSILEDFTCPSGELWAFSAANIQIVVIETSRGY